MKKKLTVLLGIIGVGLAGDGWGASAFLRDGATDSEKIAEIHDVIAPSWFKDSAYMSFATKEGIQRTGEELVAQCSTLRAGRPRFSYAKKKAEAMEREDKELMERIHGDLSKIQYLIFVNSISRKAVTPVAPGWNKRS